MLSHSLHLPTPRDLPLLAALGACATLAQRAMKRPYRKGNTLVASTLPYRTVVLASLFGMLSGMPSIRHARRANKLQNFDNLSQAPTL